MNTRTLTCLFLLIGLLVHSAVDNSAVGRAAEPKATAIRNELLKLHNKERNDADVKPLSLNAELTKAAQAYADYLAESGEFSHTAKGTIRSRVKDTGYKPRAVGENIASGQPTPIAVVKDWLESETHKGNILSEEFSEVGFGFALDKEGQMIWVTDFGDH